MNNHQRLAIHEAMIRLAQGDRGAFSAVFGGLWTPLLQFMQRAVQGHPDIEDLAQQTLLKIFSRISDFDTTRDGVSWALVSPPTRCERGVGPFSGVAKRQSHNTTSRSRAKHRKTR
jgi:hypothetical protein